MTWNSHCFTVIMRLPNSGGYRAATECVERAIRGAHPMTIIHIWVLKLSTGGGEGSA